MGNKEWFKEAAYGMMVHWGLYSLPAGEWKGARMPHIGEWLQSYFRIPKAEYGKLAGSFNPLLFDADEWVRLAIDSGMKYLVVTAKHHDGFALFHSRVDGFNMVDATPFRRDIIGELADACYRHNFKLGLYYSQDLDWREPHGGGYLIGRTNCGCMSWTNDWDYPEKERKDYSRCFEKKIKPQVEELLKNYGDLCLIWFDTPLTIRPEQGNELYRLVKRYQPNCLINSRIGNGLGDYRSWGDNEIPEQRGEAGLYETPATINDTWGYKSFDQNWKSADEIARIKHHLNSRGINYLLNVGPDYLGRIPGPSVDVLRAVGSRSAGAHK